MQKLLLILIIPFFSFGQAPGLDAVADATGLIGEFVPQCEIDGSFSPMQCWVSTGYCWCVDEDGVEILGTALGPGQGTPNCDSFEVIGCEDADETILNILSLFMNDPGFGFFGCADIIPYLESQTIIPLDCNTNLTPFGYFNMSVADVCECSCEEYLNLDIPITVNRKIINTISIIGQPLNQMGLQLEIYDDGSVEKKYLTQ